MTAYCLEGGVTSLEERGRLQVNLADTGQRHDSLKDRILDNLL